MSRSIKPNKWDKNHFFVEQITVAQENDLLYDKFGIANIDDHALAYSIQENGIQEPLTISKDFVLLSGHRRLAAAKYIGLQTVPVRVTDVSFYDLEPSQRLELLRLHNQQREKSPGERVREKLLDIDPAASHVELRKRRRASMSLIDAPESNVLMGSAKRRARITTIQFLKAVMRVIGENKEYWPLTDRRVHYLLLNDPPLKHDKKLGARYANDKGSYKALTNLLLRARLTGDVPMTAIEDSTRPIQLGGGFSTFEQFVAQETGNFLIGYSRNLMQGQPHHIEIMLEKNALRTVIESVASEYCIPITTGRGFSSLAPRYDLYQRYIKSGKQRLILLMLTDFDPDGEEIAASFARSLRDDFGVQDIHAIKVALTYHDIIENDLHSDMDAKVSSPNYEKFIRRFGSKVVELDAAPVRLLQSALRGAIESVIDRKEYNAQIDLEAQDAANIEAHRQVVMDAIGGQP